MVTKDKKAVSGFTLMELTIVLALLAIIAAVLIPLFLTTTDRARLRSDIQSVRVIQNAMDLYRVERGRAVTGNDAETILRNLSVAGYLDLRNPDPQTENAEWIRVEENNIVRIFVYIGDSPDGVRRAYGNLTDVERTMVRGGVRND